MRKGDTQLTEMTFEDNVYIRDSTPTIKLQLAPGTPTTAATFTANDEAGNARFIISSGTDASAAATIQLFDQGGETRFFIDSDGNLIGRDDGGNARVDWEVGSAADDVVLKVIDGTINSSAWGFIVKNTSGAAAVAGDVGYLDASNEYQTTTTAEDEKANPVAVLVGGANNADIYVTSGPGRATLNYTGSAPSTGDILTFSATAGSVQARSTMHPAILAQARANGSGGTVEVELRLRRTILSLSPDDFFFRVDNAAESDFVATIDSLPGGAVVRYDTPSSGSETCIKPQASTIVGKIRLHNTTRGDYALIESVDTTGGAGYDGEITLTAAVPGTWQATDTITARSQNGNTTPQGTAYWFDVEIPDTTVIPELATRLEVQFNYRDTAGTSFMATHPYKADNQPDQYFTGSQVANLSIFQYGKIALIARTIDVVWQTSGGGTTARPRFRCLGVEVAC